MIVAADLFGFPITFAPPVAARKHREVSLEDKRARFCRKLAESPNLLLFENLLDILSRPLFQGAAIPTEFVSDISGVEVRESDVEEGCAEDIEIPYEQWGKTWVTDRKGFKWSREGILYTQIRLFWRSMEELTLRNNAREKMSVLKWVFRPAIEHDFMFDRDKGKSHCLMTHERDDPFSFHNCCIAARMNEDTIREGFRRNIPKEVLNTVEKAHAIQ